MSPAGMNTACCCYGPIGTKVGVFHQTLFVWGNQINDRGYLSQDINLEDSIIAYIKSLQTAYPSKVSYYGRVWSIWHKFSTETWEPKDPNDPANSPDPSDWVYASPGPISSDIKVLFVPRAGSTYSVYPLYYPYPIQYFEPEIEKMVSWLAGHPRRLLVVCGGTCVNTSDLYNYRTNDLLAALGSTMRLPTAGATIWDNSMTRSRLCPVYPPHELLEDVNYWWDYEVQAINYGYGYPLASSFTDSSAWSIAIEGQIVLIGCKGFFDSSYGTTYDVIPEANVKLLLNIIDYPNR